jgi:hypothetical protein
MRTSILVTQRSSGHGALRQDQVRGVLLNALSETEWVPCLDLARTTVDQSMSNRELNSALVGRAFGR